MRIGLAFFDIKHEYTRLNHPKRGLISTILFVKMISAENG